MAKEKIIAKVIIQMMGAPKKHIEETLKMYVDKIKKDHEHINVLKEYQSPAEKQKESKLYNVFSELEIEALGTENLVWFCFDYMPASIEIIEPEKLVYESRDFTGFLNDLQAKMHKVDMAIKNLSAENQVVKKNGVTLLKNIIILQLKTGPKDVKTLAKNAGVPEDNVQTFVSAMIDEGKIKKDKDKYTL